MNRFGMSRLTAAGFMICGLCQSTVVIATATSSNMGRVAAGDIRAHRQSIPQLRVYGQAPRKQSTKTHTGHSHSYSHAGNYSIYSRAASVRRTSIGRVTRSSSARRSFRKSNPCPSTGQTSGVCPGHVMDHVAPLKRGGADHPSNMQWQTTEAAKIKDKTE